MATEEWCCMLESLMLEAANGVIWCDVMLLLPEMFVWGLRLLALLVLGNWAKWALEEEEMDLERGGPIGVEVVLTGIVCCWR